MPSPYAFFESMHSTNDTPATIANGSWNTQYSPYPFSCKFFDSALYDKYQGDVYIASAGNDGLDESMMKSRDRSIGNPASCKNTIAGKSVNTSLIFEKFIACRIILICNAICLRLLFCSWCQSKLRQSTYCR
jgi:hypothetical protein